MPARASHSMADRRGHSHDVNAATVVAAEQVAAAGQERLRTLEQELGIKQREVAAASRQVRWVQRRRLLCARGVATHGSVTRLAQRDASPGPGAPCRAVCRTRGLASLAF